MRLAEWVPEALLAAPVEPVASSGVYSGEVALGEILALRSLLLNLHFRAAKGEPVAESEMRGLTGRRSSGRGSGWRRFEQRPGRPEPEPETAAETEPEEG